jgi:hypothetical protein
LGDIDCVHHEFCLALLRAADFAEPTYGQQIEQMAIGEEALVEQRAESIQKRQTAVKLCEVTKPT